MGADYNNIMLLSSNRYTLSRRWTRLVVASVLVVGTATCQQNPANRFRVCCFSDYMPLSNQGPDEVSGRRGLFVDLAQEFAREMGKELEIYHPMPAFYKRPVRAGLLQDRCDAHMGLPRTEGNWYIPGKVVLSNPFMSIGYAIAAPKSLEIGSLEDLSGKTVGVLAGSPPQFALAQIDGVRTRNFLFPEPAMAALQEIDAAFVWGPTAGYLNKFSYGGEYQIVSTELSWPLAIGVRPENTLLKEKLDALIDKLGPEIETLKDKYGLPSGRVIVVEWPNKGAPSTSEDQALLYAFHAAPEDIERGRNLFNGTFGCAHCHGPSAQAAEQKMDLRRLVRRHGPKAEEIFLNTVRKGRAGTEMPEWKDVLAMNEQWLTQLRSFVFSIQE